MVSAMTSTILTRIRNRNNPAASPCPTGSPLPNTSIPMPRMAVTVFLTTLYHLNHLSYAGVSGLLRLTDMPTQEQDESTRPALFSMLSC